MPGKYPIPPDQTVNYRVRAVFFLRDGEGGRMKERERREEEILAGKVKADYAPGECKGK